MQRIEERGAHRADDERFMREALAEARAAAELGEVPIGAVVVHEGKIIARSHNRRELDEDPSAHAEFAAMVAASRALGRWRLTGCTVYVTLEPCLMCAGLMVNARIDRCVYGAADPKGGATGTLYDVSGDTRLNHAFEVTSGVLQDECASVLRTFFRTLRGRADDADAETSSHVGCAHAHPAPGKGFLLAVDSFKGSATSAQAEAWLAEGIRLTLPEAHVACLPVADGGEGLIDALYAARSGEIRSASVTSLFGSRVQARYLMLSEEDEPAGGKSSHAGADGTKSGSDVGAAELADGKRSLHADGCDSVAVAADVACVEAPGEEGAPRVDASRLNAPRALSAVIETAEVVGLAGSPRTHDAALRATTCGVGELMLRAVSEGARTLYLGLGGSATTDGGAGMLQALGARLLDAAGQPILLGLMGLRDVAHIDIEPARAALRGVRLVALSDVKNPLVGPRGAVRVFGPQKGLASDLHAAGGSMRGMASAEDGLARETACAKNAAASKTARAKSETKCTPECPQGDEVREAALATCDSWMAAYGARLTAARDALDGTELQVGDSRRRARSLAGVPGAGAAGGLGAALLALGAELTSGIDAVLDLVHFDEEALAADIVVTGEGSLDAQSLEGKVPVGVASRVKRANANAAVIAVCGGRADDLGEAYNQGIDIVLPIMRRPMALDEALAPQETRRNLIAAGETIARIALLR